LENKLGQLRLTQSKLNNENQQLEEEIEEMKRYCESSDKRIRNTGYDFKKLWQERILQLKGNVRVFCRVRPLN
jgi:peptidoglycan hydrolase CwlO-like protein